MRLAGENPRRVALLRPDLFGGDITLAVTPAGGTQVFAPLPGVTAWFDVNDAKRGGGAFIAGPHVANVVCRIVADGPIAMATLSTGEARRLFGGSLARGAHAVMAIDNPILDAALRRRILALIDGGADLSAPLLEEWDAGGAHDTAPRIRDLIEAQTPLQDAAAELGVSVRQMQRIFRHETGLSPVSWRMLARLRDARDMIVQTQNAFADIAADCGFFDQSHFVRAYKAWTGATPSADRRLGRRDVVFLQDAVGRQPLPLGLLTPL